MSLFGGRRKAEQEEAGRVQREEQAERQRLQTATYADDERRRKANYARILVWFEALEKHQATGAPVLTDEILQAVGPFPFPPKAWGDHDGRMQFISDVAGMKAYGRAVAKEYDVEATIGKREGAQYWASVKEYCEGVLGLG